MLAGYGVFRKPHEIYMEICKSAPPIFSEEVNLLQRFQYVVIVRMLSS